MTLPIGTVAWVDVDGESSYKAIKGERGWVTSAALSAESDREIAAERVTRIQPVVELDIAALPVRPKSSTISVLRQWQRFAAEQGQRVDANVLGAIADQIESQTKPPRIPEPGLWGVVEAATKGDDAPTPFVRTDLGSPYCWQHAPSGTVARWDDLIDPVLIRQGVES